MREFNNLCILEGYSLGDFITDLGALFMLNNCFEYLV